MDAKKLIDITGIAWFSQPNTHTTAGGHYYCASYNGHLLYVKPWLFKVDRTGLTRIWLVTYNTTLINAFLDNEMVEVMSNVMVDIGIPKPGDSHETRKIHHRTRGTRRRQSRYRHSRRA